MKWLRSSIFRENNDIFTFEQKIDINLNNVNASLNSAENIVVKGILTRISQDKINVNLNIKGNYKIISSRTLEIIDLPFDINEQDEFISKTTYLEKEESFNIMDNYIDLNNFVRELLILNIPNSYHLEGENIEYSQGKDWILISEEDLVEEKKKLNPFSSLTNMFKEK